MLVLEAATRTQIPAHFADGLVTVTRLTYGGAANRRFPSRGEGQFHFFQLTGLRAIDDVHGYGWTSVKKPPA